MTSVLPTEARCTSSWIILTFRLEVNRIFYTYRLRSKYCLKTPWGDLITIAIIVAIITEQAMIRPTIFGCEFCRYQVAIPPKGTKWILINQVLYCACQISMWDIFLWVSYESENWVLISSAKGTYLPEYFPSNTDFAAQITVQTNVKMQWVIFSPVLRTLSNICLHVCLCFPHWVSDHRTRYLSTDLS